MILKKLGTDVVRLRHSIMRWNLTSKKFPTETEYGVWKLIGPNSM